MPMEGNVLDADLDFHSYTLVINWQDANDANL